MKLEIFEVFDNDKKKEYWNIFKKHHYLTDDFPVQSRVFVGYLDNVLCAFTSFYVFPNGSVRKYMASSRHVVLPDYQNLGLGTRMIEFTANYLRLQGFKPYIKSTLFKLKEYIQNGFGQKSWLNMGIQCRYYAEAFDKYENDLPKGVDPYTYNKPFKVYDHKRKDKINNSDCGDHSFHWVNRESISARYVGTDFMEKEHILIIMENPVNRNSEPIYDKFFDSLSDEFYYEVYNGTTDNGSYDQIYTDWWQLDSYALRDKKGIRNKIYKGMEYESYISVIYVYNNRNKKLKSFLENNENINQLWELNMSEPKYKIKKIW